MSKDDQHFIAPSDDNFAAPIQPPAARPMNLIGRVALVTQPVPGTAKSVSSNSIQPKEK